MADTTMGDGDPERETDAPPPAAPPEQTNAAVDGDGPRTALQRFVNRCIETTGRVSDPTKAARLSYAAGRVCEELLGDRARAEECYLEAFGRDPELDPNLRAAQRLMSASGEWKAVLDLLDAELRRGTLTPEAQAEIYLERGTILDRWVKDAKGAREAYACAMELDERNPQIWMRLVAALDRERAWSDLDDLFERVRSLAESPALRAVLAARRAALKADRLDAPDEAIALFEEALAIEPDLTQAYLGLGRLYHAAKRWSDLIDLQERQLKLLDGAPKVLCYYQLARLYTSRLGRADLAIECLAKAERFEPDDVLIQSELSRLYEQVARYADQVRTDERLLALSVDPADKLSLHHRIGMTCEEHLGDDLRAIWHYRQAIELKPGHSPAVQALGRLYRAHGKLDDLLQMHLIEARQATDVEQQALAHYRAGEMLESQLGRVDAAVDQYQEAVRWVPSFLPAQRALSRLYTRLGRWEDMVALLEREAEGLRGGSLVGDRQDPLRVARLEQIGRILEDEIGDLDRAALTYKRIRDIDSGHVGALYALKRINEKAGKWSEVIDVLEREAELVEDQGWAVALFHQMGEIAEENLGDRNLAALYYRRALAIRPSYVPTLTALGRILSDQGAFADLLALFRKEAEVTENVGRLAVIHYRMGKIHEVRLNEPEPAEECYRTAIEHDPELWPALRALERLLGRRRRWDDLADVLEGQTRLLESPIHRAVSYFRVGELWEERLGKLKSAGDAYSQALSASPGFFPARVALSRLARLRGAQAQLAEALGEQIGVVGDGFAALLVLTELAEVFHHELGALADAAETYEEIAALAPNDLGALLALYEIRWFQGQDATAAERIEVDAKLAEVCRRLVAASDDPLIKVGALRELGATLERNEPNPSDAKETWVEVLSLRSDDLAARRRLGGDVVGREASEVRAPEVTAAVELLRAMPPDDVGALARALETFQAVYAAAQDWAGLARALDQMLDLLGTTDGERPARVAVMTAKAGIMSAHLENPAEAERILRSLLDDAPDHVETRLTLAETLARSESSRDEAVAEHLQVLARDPGRLGSVQALKKIWQEAGQLDRACCALDVLSCFKVPPSPEDDACREQRRAQGEERGRTIERETLARRVLPASPAAPPEAVALLKLLEPHLARVYPPDLGAYGLSREDRIPPPERHPLRVRGEGVGWLLDVPAFDLFLHQVPGKGVGLELTEPPSLILPHHVAAWPVSSHLFVLGQLMGGVALGTWVRWKLLSPELEVLLVAAARMHVPGHGGDVAPAEVLDKLRRKLERVLPEAAQDALAGPARAFAGRSGPPIDYGAWVRDMERAHARVGLLCCGDFETALTVLGRDDRTIADLPRETTADLVAIFSGSAILRDLLSWYLSEDHFALRQLAGLDRWS
jgi:tetratricopeptide (TPR) repeat protein